MITLQEWMELCNYKITESSNYCWTCYGYNAQQFDSWSGDYIGGYSIGIVFDTKDQTVYEVDVHDYSNKRSYRIINPIYIKAHTSEVETRRDDDCAYDTVPYIDLELDEDFIEKATAIVSGTVYDEGILIPINLEDHVLLQAFRLAHEANMTFNDYVNMALRTLIIQLKKEEE